MFYAILCQLKDLFGSLITLAGIDIEQFYSLIREALIAILDFSSHRFSYENVGSHKFGVCFVATFERIKWLCIDKRFIFSHHVNIQ